MKNSIKKSETQNKNAFANFQNSALTKLETKNVKGGNDPIVIEDIIMY